MSGAGITDTGIGKVLGNVTGVINEPGKKLFQKVGFNDSVSSFLSGGLLSLQTQRENNAKRKEEEHKKAVAETQRQAENDRVFSLAESLSSKITSNPNFNFEQLRFRGNDPRNQQLQDLVASLQGRAATIQSQQITPGGSQTRLSLV